MKSTRTEVTKTDLIDKICKGTTVSRSLLRALTTLLFEQIAEEINAGNDVKIRGLGSFRWVDTEGRSKGAVVYPPGKKLRFVPSKEKLTTRR